MTKGDLEKHYTEEYARVRKLAVSLVGPDDADDVLQEVYTRILANPKVLAKAISGTSFYSWFSWRVTQYVKREVFLHERTKDSVEQNTISFKALEGTKDEGYHPFDEDDSPLIEQALRTAMETLTEEEHEIVTLHLFAQWDWQKIAESLGRPRTHWDAIRQVYRRAIPKLRLYLESVGIQGPSFDDNTMLETDHNAA